MNLKFRAWDGKEYHYDIAIYNGKAYIPDQGLLVEPIENAVIEVFSGRHDVNGEKIYKGDIITEGHSRILVEYGEYATSYNNRQYTILETGFGWYGVKNNGKIVNLFTTVYGEWKYKKIGNINQNPELLK